MSVKHFFITGTDTDAGKTFIAQSLLRCLNGAGHIAVGYKPISAGCEQTPEGLRNEDALILQQHSGIPLEYNEVNPIAFAPPVAPHLAAQEIGQLISLTQLQEGLTQLESYSPDVVLTEGAGGWRLPIDNNGTYLSAFAQANQMEVILVVGVKLGCLNHAMLTLEAIKHDGLTVKGWVANQIEPDMLYFQQNVDSLQAMLHAPCLGVVPRLSSPEACDTYLDIRPLVNT
ncbi:dethiobiotin synthase [Aestuariibacter sp. AA17]|uniref:ATP-dependent dethiobiotin synthetase BioD n=1 Tax=Fluctibacter corallii TaxID=2984329 RepID=A0ABT3ABI0_9ALTE|nr:dethiobiotin synthase [Aestuariibacter sp. AA17]MCV2885988.1 dethiobiotin synthase [Aestuariibacter sp. AA17]